ncbi:cysteine synthase [Aureococcus anophagefferens]|nr:cysteine synthase [Aureococcus anophagefferens]
MGRHGLMRPLRHPRLIAAAATVSAYALLRWLRRKRLRRALAPAHPSWRDSAQAQLIGSTPLLPLHSLSKLCGCTILAKCEQANPSGTGKDRIALAMLAEAEASGALPSGGGGVVVEGSSGSTTIGLAPLVAAAGHRLVAVLPDDCAAEKRDAIAAFPGITVEVVRGVDREPDALRTARSGARPPLGRTVDAFAMGAGTGGTIAGVSLGLGDGPRIYLADPQGSSLHGRVRHGVCYDARQAERFVERHRYDTIMDGVGLDRVTANFRAARVDDACRVSDATPLTMAHYLREGLFLGSSSALNCVAALRAAAELRKAHPDRDDITVVTVLCDSGHRTSAGSGTAPSLATPPETQAIAKPEASADDALLIESALAFARRTSPADAVDRASHRSRAAQLSEEELRAVLVGRGILEARRTFAHALSSSARSARPTSTGPARRPSRRPARAARAPARRGRGAAAARRGPGWRRR